MKYFFCFCFLNIVVLNLFSQANTNTKVYLLDKDFMGVKDMDKASHILNVEKINDSLFQYIYYNAFTLKAEQLETYSDESGKQANGRFVYYNKDGTIDSTGLVKSGVRQSSWYFYKSFKNKIDSLIEEKKYVNGVLDKKINSIENSADLEKQAVFNGSFKEFLGKNLIYPRKASSINAQGVIKMIFKVTSNGHIEDMFLKQSNNYFLDM